MTEYEAILRMISTTGTKQECSKVTNEKGKFFPSVGRLLGHYDNLGLDRERLFSPSGTRYEVDAFAITIYPSCGSFPPWVIHWATLPVQLAQMRPQPERYLATKEFSLLRGVKVTTTDKDIRAR